jgi:methylene-tetrahydromethanopterin dehydrogenase
LERKRLLYLVSSDPQVSPFDINMAYDAGFDVVVPFAGVTVPAVRGLVQDVMFSRGPKGARASSVFFSGSDLTAAEGMLASARSVLFDPFRIGLMIDPRGGYTTAAAILARVSAAARDQGLGDLRRLSVLVMAGTGGVGKSAAAMAALEGARVVLTSRRQASADAAAREILTLFEAKVEARAAATEEELRALSAPADVLLATGPAGVQLLSRRTLELLRGPKIVVDVNAAPPAGIEGLGPQIDGAEIGPGLHGIGALAIGTLKNKVESSLLKDLLTAEAAPILDSRAARGRADEILAAR